MPPLSSSPQLPELSNASLKATTTVSARNEYNQLIEGSIAIERALTIYLDKREIVTLMTLGNHPEMLILGWLRNQRIVDQIDAIQSVQVDWETDSVAITTRNGSQGLEKKLARKTVTTGCGQGTMFGDLLENIDGLSLQAPNLKQSDLYSLLNKLNQHNDIYKNAGAVHGCALCSPNLDVLQFIEDVGRHNAVDAIAGYMWLNQISGQQMLFYTTGRLTSEMVIKVALMQIPVLISRSGITAMGLEIAQKVGVTLIARAKGRHFLVYKGAETIDFDDLPSRPQNKKSSA